jgi:serine/threonine-protein kinase
MSMDEREDVELAGSPYVRVRELGRGGMGTVLLVRHRALGTRVVLKLIHESYARDPELVERLRVEAQTQAKLRSPHLLVCHDFGVTARGVPYFATDYVEGVTLQDELGRRGALPLAEALEIARQILAGLAVAHRVGVVHRDIKPSNLLVTREGGQLVVKILDFGVAKVLPKEALASGESPAPSAFPTAEGLIVGTPRYCSPEQALAKPVDERADLFTVGLVLAQMVTGRAPHADKLDLATLLLAQVLEPTEPPSLWNPGVPPELDELVLRAVEKDPAHRYATAAEMQVAVEQVLALVPRAAPVPPTDVPKIHAYKTDLRPAAAFPVAPATAPAAAPLDQTERLQAVSIGASGGPTREAAPRDLSLAPAPTVCSAPSPLRQQRSRPIPTARRAPGRLERLLGFDEAIPRWWTVTVTVLLFFILILSVAILVGR